MEITQQRDAQKMPSETTTACVSLLVFFRIRRGTFPYGVKDNVSTISQTPTTRDTSTSVKLTIVPHLSFHEHIAIANLYFIFSERAAWGVGVGCAARRFPMFSFPCSAADHERDWPPPCKVVFSGWQPIR